MSESSASTWWPARARSRASVPAITDLPAPPLPTTARRILAGIRTGPRYPTGGWRFLYARHTYSVGDSRVRAGLATRSIGFAVQGHRRGGNVEAIPESGFGAGNAGAARSAGRGRVSRSPQGAEPRREGHLQPDHHGPHQLGRVWQPARRESVEWSAQERWPLRLSLDPVLG